jgi:hypothetical protein
MVYAAKVEGEGEDAVEPRPPSAVFKGMVMLLFIFVIMPVIMLILAALFGAIIAPLEGWSVWEGFLYMVSNLAGLSEPLTDVEPPLDPGAIALDVIVTTWTLGMTGVFIGTIANLTFTAVIIDYVELRAGVAANLPTPTALKQVSGFVVTIFVLLSIVIVFIGVVLGALLARGEGWTIAEGVLYVIGNMVGLANP